MVRPVKEFKNIERILVIKLRHIGDVLLTVPAIRALRETFPNAHIAALVNSGTEDMLTLNPLVDEVMCYRREIKGHFITRRISEEIRLVKDLKKRAFDMAVDLTGGDRAALTAFLAGARYRLAYDMKGSGFIGKRRLYTHLAPQPRPMTHAVLRDLGLMNSFGMDTSDLSVDIYAHPEDDAFVQRVLGEAGLGKGESFVHVHPTSRWLFKCWTDLSMAKVMDRLDESGHRVVLTSSADKAELERVKSIKALMRSSPVDLSGRLRLKHLASLSRRSLLFFGVDTAPMHIAAAVGTRVVALFGPSGAFDWGPWDNANALRMRNRFKEARQGSSPPSPYRLRSGVQVNGLHTVIQKDWACVPCGKAGCDDTRRSRCLDEVTPDSVWKIISRVIEQKGRSVAR
jgi:heptosyltransferase-3